MVYIILFWIIGFTGKSRYISVDEVAWEKATTRVQLSVGALRYFFSSYICQYWIWNPRRLTPFRHRQLVKSVLFWDITQRRVLFYFILFIYIFLPCSPFISYIYIYIYIPSRLYSFLSVVTLLPRSHRLSWENLPAVVSRCLPPCTILF
jgi:hypothetical protein